MDKDEIVAFHNYVCQVAKIRELPVTFKNVKSYAGKAMLNKSRTKGHVVYADPYLVELENEKLQESIVIHEIAHFVNWWDHMDRYLGCKCDHHGHDFKVIERYLLKQFGMRPAYGGKYAIALFDGEGKILWTNPRTRTSSIYGMD